MPKVVSKGVAAVKRNDLVTNFFDFGQRKIICDKEIFMAGLVRTPAALEYVLTGFFKELKF